MYRSYSELYAKLNEALPGWDIVFGTSKEELRLNTCYITNTSSDISYSDDIPMVQSTTYQLTFMSSSPVFTNIDVIELTAGGVELVGYDAATSCHVFNASVVLFGPNSIPTAEDI